MFYSQVAGDLSKMSKEMVKEAPKDAEQAVVVEEEEKKAEQAAPAVAIDPAALLQAAMAKKA
jgi:hypothetical protein